MRQTPSLVRARFIAALLCAVTLMPAQAADRAPIKTIGIVSDVGDKVHHKHIGFMVFSNKEAALDVPDWAIDAHITTALSDGLRERYELKPVEFPRGTIAPVLDDPFDAPDPEDTMRANAKPTGGASVDAYVVAWPTLSDVYGTNQNVQGIGLLTQGGRAMLYLAVRVTLLDGSTFKEIDSCSARMRDRSFWNPEKSTMNEVPDFEDVESLDALTPEQKQTMQAGLKQMLTDGMTYCLRDLKLVE
ncbi:MAG: hypothetical protein KBA31_01970 [Alphaproteobacteria bacterium]|nr:hypothetical protein [Alphaproteobacteria bacterium]